jgi:hypothetical protein
MQNEQAATNLDFETSQIFASIRRTNLMKYISYGGMRLKKQTVWKHIPEIAVMSREFGPGSLHSWHQSMQYHNQILKRGEKLSLCQNVKVQKLKHFSLDTFLLQMHSRQIAQLLQSLTSFGERVRTLIRQDPGARSWWLPQDMLIQRRHWLALSRNVMHLIRVLGFHELEDTPMPLHPWLDYDVLSAAALEVARIFGPFDGSDGRCPPPCARPRARRSSAGDARRARQERG